MDCYGITKDISAKYVNTIDVYKDLLGLRDLTKASEYGFEPGLNIPIHCNVLKQQRELLKKNNSIQILIVGGFNTGKSTLINALLRRNVLPMSVWAECAIINEMVIDYSNTK